MKTFAQSFTDVYKLSELDIKPLGAKLGKLMEEVGELAECVNIHQGFITHKEMKEPLVGEVADVVQCALAILVDAHPELSRKELTELFLAAFERKNKKWEQVQSGDAARVAARGQEYETPEERARPKSKPNDINSRVHQIVQEQLGVGEFDLTPGALLVENLGADSLDLVELVMAIEDEFEFEISDRDAERIRTVEQMIAYVKGRYGIAEPLPIEEESMCGFESENAMADQRFHDEGEAEANFKHFDPAAEYTERTGRHLSLDERMRERARFNVNKGKGDF